MSHLAHLSGPPRGWRARRATPIRVRAASPHRAGRPLLALVGLLLLALSMPHPVPAQAVPAAAASTTAAPTASRAVAPRAAAPRAVAPFAVRVVGRGPAMFFIPGLTSGGAVWDDVVAQFADRYECHVFTLAGFAGQPPVAADSTWLPRMRDALIAYARERGIARPVLVGHSLGGFLALDIAATDPALPRAVVNVDGLPFLAATISPTATVESVRPMAVQMRQAMRGGDAAQGAQMPQQSQQQMQQMQEQQLRTMIRDTTRLPLARAMGRASDPATVAEATYALFVTDLRPRLAQVTAPVLNLHAWVAYRAFGQTRDGMQRLLAGQYATLPTAVTRISDTAYHFIMFDEPRWLADEMRAFLASAR